jgi:hypothetical protein
MFSAVRGKREPLMDLISFSDCCNFRCQSVALLEMVLPHFNALVGVGRWQMLTMFLQLLLKRKLVSFYAYSSSMTHNL